MGIHDYADNSKNINIGIQVGRLVANMKGT